MTDGDELDEDETRHLVDSDLEELVSSRTPSPEQDEDGHYPRIMMNHSARVSQTDINVSPDQMPHDASPLHKKDNGLSSQAGAILVSPPDFCSWS
jgi:solute carrier family 45 protein 1/2/4